MGLDFTVVWEGLPYLLLGALVTIEVTVIALVLGSIIGLMAGLARLSKNRYLAGLAAVYVAFIRGTPLLVQLFILYFGLPQMGVKLPAFLCGVIGLSIYSGSYISEIVRGAIQSIDRGQTEAARSLGFSPAQTMRLVVLPQAFLRMLPPLGNEFIALIKNSSLVSLLTIQDLMRAGQRIISITFRSFEVYIAVAVLYFLLTYTMSVITRRMEQALRIQ